VTSVPSPEATTAPASSAAGPVAPTAQLVTRGRLATPTLLRAGMALACVPITVFAAAVHLGITRSESTVETVGRDATRGITVAQEIKANLSELDGIVVQNLLEPVTSGPSGFPDDYNARRRELDENLVLAASEAPPGAAYQQPLVNIAYALGHYHAFMRDTFAASARGDSLQAAALYGQAHEIMEGTLLPQADSFDKSNTYVLNDTYESHKADSASTVRLIFVSWIVVLVFLVIVQLLVARKFRRVVNLALATATVIAAVTGTFALARLDSSSSNLAEARERAFDPVHQLARARATVVSARQAEGQWLLDPSGTSASQADFTAQTRRLFRLGDADVTAIAQAGQVPEGAGGYLTTVIDADVSPDGNAAAEKALVALGDFLEEDDRLRALVASGDMTSARARFRTGEAFAALTDALDQTQSIDQRTFDTYAAAAADATKRVDLANLVAAGAIVVLTILGLYQRLREYQQ
jgi:hypothetical protein